MKEYNVNGEEELIKTAKLNLVDLAGDWGNPFWYAGGSIGWVGAKWDNFYVFCPCLYK